MGWKNFSSEAYFGNFQISFLQQKLFCDNKGLPNRCMRTRMYNFLRHCTHVFHFSLRARTQFSSCSCTSDRFMYSTFSNICTPYTSRIFCFTLRSIVSLLLGHFILSHQLIFIWDPVMAPCDPSSDPISSHWRRSSVFIV